MRPQGWESLLAAHIATARPRAFAWGEHDCVLWCADWVNLITGTDPAADWRGQHTTEAEALAILAELGCSTWADLANLHLPELSPARARRGDIMLHPVHGGLGICDGVHAYFIAARGLTRIEYTACPRAWSVG